MTQERIMIAVDANDLSALRAEVAALRQEIRGATIRPREDWETIPDYARRIGRTAQTVRLWIRQGRVETQRRGNVTMVRVNPGA